MARVVVFGSSNTDMTVRVPRLPIPGQTLLGDSFAISPGGKGANQAVAARRAGADVVFVTAVGDDDLGRQALELYRGEGINVDYARIVPGASSGVALIFVGRDGENMIGVAPGANQRLNPEDVDRLDESLFKTGDVLLVGLEIPIATAIAAMKRGHAAGMTVVLNPAPAPTISQAETRDLLSHAEIITPNRGEALALAGLGPPGNKLSEPSLVACSRRLLEMGPRALVITLGAHGCLVAGEGMTTAIAAPKVEAVDTVGAGDAFNGALAVALGEHCSLLHAADWAMVAAALAVTRPGAQSALPRREEIDAFYEGGRG
jgi:ribokinase